MRQKKIESPFSLFSVRNSFVLMAVCMVCAPVFGACHAVSPTGSGAMTGANWSNAYANLPSTLVRGDIYYLADGNYGTSLNISTSASGTTTITIKKAQAYDFGRSSDGCPNDISSGWNAATMGAAQAIWQNTPSGGGSFVHIGSGGYYIIDGNGQSAPPTVGCGGVQTNPPASMTAAPSSPSDCGIKWDDSTCTATSSNGCDGGAGMIRGGGPGIQLKSMEIKGQGLNPAGNNDSETYGWFATGNLSGVVLTQMYFHNMGTTDFTVTNGGWDNGCTFSYVYSWGEFDGSVNHGEAIQLQGSNGQATPCNIHHNIFRDQQTNGDVVAVIGGTQTYNFYDNVDFCSAGGTSTSCRHNDGVIGCFNSQVCSNVKVFNNTFAEPSNCGFNVTGGASTITWENNLFYDCGSMTTNNGSGGTSTIDYNSYLKSNISAHGSHDVVNSSATSPFVSLTNGNFQLTSDSDNYNNRLSLGSPFDTTTLYGNPFTTDRGAAQFAPGAPIALGGSVTQ